MVRSRLFNITLFREKFSTILSRISKRGGETKPNLEALKIARGLILLFVSILLGWTSIEFTKQQSIRAFEESHWPMRPIWKMTLSHYGLTQRATLGDYSKLLESNPAAFLGESKIWINPNACVVLLPKSPYDSGPELWTCEPTSKAETWKNLGSGLPAFETLIDILEKFPRKTSLAPQKSVKSIDPKEFHY